MWGFSTVKRNGTQSVLEKKFQFNYLFMKGVSIQSIAESIYSSQISSLMDNFLNLSLL